MQIFSQEKCFSGLPEENSKSLNLEKDPNCRIFMAFRVDILSRHVLENPLKVIIALISYLNKIFVWFWNDLCGIPFAFFFIHYQHPARVFWSHKDVNKL